MVLYASVVERGNINSAYRDMFAVYCTIITVISGGWTVGWPVVVEKVVEIVESR